MICQTPNDDPCSRVTSPAEAMKYAEALLTTSAEAGLRILGRGSCWTAGGDAVCGLAAREQRRDRMAGAGGGSQHRHASGDSARCVRHGAGVRAGDSAIAVSGRPAATGQRAADARSS